MLVDEIEYNDKLIAKVEDPILPSEYCNCMKNKYVRDIIFFQREFIL